MTAEQANAIILRAYRTLQKPVQNGAALRQEMHASLRAGKVPGGYRFVFLNEVAEELVKILDDAALHFKMSHPDDEFSNNDLKDILAFTAKLIK